MSNFKSSIRFAEMLIDGSIQLFTTEEGAEFDIMMLTDEQKVEVETCATYKEMLKTAADYGLSLAGGRALDNEYIAKNIELFWKDDTLDTDIEPDSKTQVALKVCEISGLSKVLEEQRIADENKVDADDYVDQDDMVSSIDPSLIKSTESL